MVEGGYIGLKGTAKQISQKGHKRLKSAEKEGGDKSIGQLNPSVFLDDPSKVDETLCIACKRCTVVCPTNSRPLKPEVLEASRKFLSSVIKEDKINQLF